MQEGVSFILGVHVKYSHSLIIVLQMLFTMSIL